MIELEPLIFVFGALVIASISWVLAACYYKPQLRTLEKTTWNKARIFYEARAKEAQK